MSSILVLLIKYKYLILLPVAILEGPFAAIIAGFLASSNVFNIFVVYVIIVLGDMIGDSFYYFLGRLSGSSVVKHGRHIGVTHEKLENAKKYFANYHHKALVISKLAYGIGISGLVAAGVLKISYKKFMKTCLFIALIQSAFLLSMGFLFGHAYLQIGNYFNVYAKIVSAIIFIFIGCLIFSKLKRKFKLS